MNRLKKTKIGKAALALLLITALFTGCGTTIGVPVDPTATPEPTAPASAETAENPETETAAAAPETAAETTETTETVVDNHEFDITLAFAGDVNLSEGNTVAAQYDSADQDVTGCISYEILSEMQNADYMVLNNEFCYSDRGTPTAGKKWTFRANPSRVQALVDMGVDAVYLANNHVYDYGEDAINDTFDTLSNAGIKYFGAGHDLDEAMSPLYVELQGKTIALVAASRAETNRKTPQATESSPGILLCYDTTLFCQTIREAKEHADYVIAVVHWGTEYSNVLESVQIETAKEYVEAGADVIIGAHPHCLQGMDYVDGKPVLYSLGNYWFCWRTVDTVLAKVHIYGDDNESHLEIQLVPAIQKNCKVNAVDSTEGRRIFDSLEEMSDGAIEIDDDGILHPAEDEE